MRIWVLFVATLLLVAMPVGAGHKLAMRVSPAYSYEPASLTIQLSIAPDAQNRVIRVITESAEFYRRSDITLDGDRAPRTNVFAYRGLPAGDYEVRSILFGERGQERAMLSQAVTVLSSGDR
jgi:hypothetical protein